MTIASGISWFGIRTTPRCTPYDKDGNRCRDINIKESGYLDIGYLVLSDLNLSTL